MIIEKSQNPSTETTDKSTIHKRNNTIYFYQI